MSKMTDLLVMRQKLIATRERHGWRRDESAELLDTLTANHEGDNLAAALVYWRFATGSFATRFAEMLASAEVSAR